MSASDATLQRLRRLAKIMGPHSSAAQALAEYDRRIGDGEDVSIFEIGGSLIVGPSLPQVPA